MTRDDQGRELAKLVVEWWEHAQMRADDVPDFVVLAQAMLTPVSGEA